MCGRKGICKWSWVVIHQDLLVRVILTPGLSGVPGGRVLTRGRGSTGVPGQLVPMIRIFNVRSGAVCRDLDPGVLHTLEAELLHRAKTMGQKQEICRYKEYVR
jgi:hypothetical protein